MRHPWIVMIYAVAMGILEAAVVVYLRKLYYSNGFDFPLNPMDPSVLRVEVIREAMTLVMLVSVALIAAERTWGRLMAFLIAFGTWDVLYYAGLKVFVGWPASLLDRDILFLIPKPWIGPVLAPILVSLLWIGAGLTLHRASVRMRIEELGGALLGAGLILASFLNPDGDANAPRFRWWIFLGGYLIGSAALARIAWRTRRIRHGV
jgi:hypothetical protein